MDLLIAIASFDGKVTTGCAESLLRDTHILRDEGHEAKMYFHSGNVYIAAARNVCVHMFLKSTCSDLIFIDSDVEFDAGSMSKLLNHDKEIVGGIYPKKQDDESFPVLVYFDPVTHNCKEEETGLVTCDMIPTGFMRIKRQVFEKMIQHYEMKPTHEGIYSFFDTGMVFDGDNTWYGEDVAFCKRWRNMGGELFAEPNINFTHTGTKHWKGNLHEYLMGRRVENIAGEMQKKYDGNEGIKGWTTDKELRVLSNLAQQSNSVVEIGSWKGRSTKALLDHCKGEVYAVDHWKGCDSDFSGFLAKREDVFNEFYNNVGHYPNLSILRGDSIEMSNRFNGNKVDMVFIDADHSYESVKADIEAWLPKTRKYICGHDYCADFPGVIRAVDEKFPNVTVIDSLWMVELAS